MARRPEVESPATRAERDAARNARNDRIQEVVLLLAWLTATNAVDAHLGPCLTAGENSTMNFVVCVHHEEARMAWRISDFEMLEYFRHLKRRDCGERGMSRADKMAYLAEMVRR